MASELEVYRKANSMMAKWRDDCICPMCGHAADESDHVFRRGTKRSFLMEHWMLRMSLCQPCHYKKHHGGGFNRVTQVKGLKVINENFMTSGDHESCYLAMDENIVSLMYLDTKAALKFIDDWLVANG